MTLSDVPSIMSSQVTYHHQMTDPVAAGSEGTGADYGRCVVQSGQPLALRTFSTKGMTSIVDNFKSILCCGLEMTN